MLYHVMMIITKIVMLVKILTNLTKIIHSHIFFSIKHIYKYRAFIDPFFHLNDMVVHTLVTWITSENVC